jgi:Rad3-related DNA helicase
LKAFTAEDVELECRSDVPRDLLEAMEIFAEEAEELQPVEPDVVQFLMDAQWFIKVAKQFDDSCYRAMIYPGENKRFAIKLWCFHPSKHIGRLFSRVGGAALFSATLAPMDFYASQLGADGEGDVQLKLESPFPKENLCVCRLPVSASFKDRERTCHAVAQIIHTMAHTHNGNYLACFPSYAYLELVYQHYRMLWPGDYVIRQGTNMNERARMAFIECFQPNPGRSMVGFIVMGGVFSEGVDLPDDRLSGAAIISTGMPQLSYEREMMRELYDDAMEGGYDAAYVYPGIRRVLQAAGRVIRQYIVQRVVAAIARYGRSLCLL